MNPNNYMKLGVNHHLLCAKDIEGNSRAHYETLKAIVEDERFDILDMWVPEDEPYRTKTIDMLLQSNKHIYYNCGNRSGRPSLAPASMDKDKREYTLSVYMDELVRAKAIGAKKLITNSGPNNITQRNKAFELLVDFYVELCQSAPEMLIMIEPTDWDMSKKKLIGSSQEAVDICRQVHQRGCPNMASMVDMCHVPLMHETLTQALTDTESCLAHIHLGNCILHDQSHPLFGDKHVPFGIEDGEYDVEEIAEVFRIGINSGYFSKKSQGSVSIEIRPLPDDDYVEALDQYYNKTIQAWKQAIN
ncbi:TIM barrel protein [Poriferisphaera sp. WC338]|uniref:TIM barrel protein n=1 Tax=Poriferisphaera sp. WC338 TaxID=3425129 RepID=UPI003D8143A3